MKPTFKECPRRYRGKRRQDKQARTLMLVALLSLLTIMALTVHATAVICEIPVREQIAQALGTSDIDRPTFNRDAKL